MARDIRQFYPGSDDHPVDEAERANGLTGDAFGDAATQVADWAQGGNNFSSTSTTLNLPGDQGSFTPAGSGVTPQVADTRYVRYDQAQTIMDTTQVFSNLGLGSAATQDSTAFAAASHTHTASEITDFDAEVANNDAVAANTAKVSFPGIGTTATTALAGNTRTIQQSEINAITANTAKTSFPGFGTSAGTALEGDTTTITTDQANAITANTAKTSFPGFGTMAGTALEGDTATITDAQSMAITANTAKVSFPGFGTTSGTALQGDTTTITTAQATAISDNTAARHVAVTLAGEGYLTLSGQQITANEINLTNNVTGQLPVANINTAQLNTLIDQRASAIGSVHRFADNTAFQANTITWHVGDILIIGDTTYLFIGTEGTSTSLTDFQQITVSGGGISQATADGRYAPISHTHTVSQITDFATGVSTNSAVMANTNKVGITTAQANAITANTAKVSFPGFGTDDMTALRGDTTVITEAQAQAITANSAKVTFPGFGNGQNEALRGNTTTITPQQATDITTNNAKVGITTAQANAITANTAKRSYPVADENKLAGIEAQAEVNVQADWSETDNTDDSFIQNKPVTITTAQAQAITANTAKVTFPGFGTSATTAAAGNHNHDDRYVRYDASQTLTEPQRSQFFNNVGAFSGLAFGGLMTQSFTAQGQNIYVLDNISTDSTMTLPTGAVGMEIRIQNLSTFQANNPSEARSSATWTITPASGERIATLPNDENLVLDVATASFILTYTGTDAGWIITGTE